jgi:hypothetical protein
VAAQPSAEKRAEIRSFVDSGAVVEAPAFVPPNNLIAAVSDAQVLELAHKDTVYSNAQASTELPVDTWALYNKPAKETLGEGMCRPMALRIRQHSASAPVQEHILKVDVGGKWAAAAADSVDEPTTFLYDSLAQLVKEYRQAAQASAVIRSLHAPVELPIITDYVWYGREFTTDAGVLRTIHAHNLKTYKDLERHGRKRGCEMQPVNYDVPHVFLARFVTGPKAFVLGYHGATKVWFILDPRSTWARMSHSLADVVSTTPVNRGE